MYKMDYMKLYQENNKYSFIHILCPYHLWVYMKIWCRLALYGSSNGTTFEQAQLWITLIKYYKKATFHESWTSFWWSRTSYELNKFIHDI